MRTSLPLQTDASTVGLLQPIVAGILAAVVGYASTFALLLAAYAATGASPAEAGSGLLAVCLAVGLLNVIISWRLKVPLSFAWSTPGAAFLLTVGAPAGGYPAALCAGPEAHPDPARRWAAPVAAGWTYVALGLFAGLAAAFIAASPPLLIEAVAGLALLPSLSSSLVHALSDEEQRLPAILAFVTAASGITLLGVGAAFWGLIAGITMILLQRSYRPRVVTSAEPSK